MTNNKEKRPTILTGDRPTGPLHLGHYAGSLLNRIVLQEEYNTFILIADVQALTDNFHQPEILKENILKVMLDYLAVGLDPEKVTFVLQSLVPEIHELTIYYLNLVTLARAFRNPTVKNEIREKRNTKNGKRIFGKNMDIPLGFLIYPIHQAADITVFDANLVPVGVDQLPMIEQTREIVRKMNMYYGKNLLTEPEAKAGDFPRIPGIDGNTKMSKSLGNCIYLNDSKEDVNRMVKKMFTDPKRIRSDIPGTVENNPVFIYHDAFNPDREEVNYLKERYKKGKVGDTEVKAKLAKAINSMLEPIRRNHMHWEKRLKEIEELLYDHTAIARKRTKAVLNRVREGMKFRPLN